MSKKVRYEVGIGGGCATGEVFVDDNATDDDIKLAVIDDLYYLDYEIVEEQAL